MSVRASLNALTTLPARMPPPPPGLLARGKSLVKFYKTGIVNVWRNRKIATQIRNAYGARSGLDLARSIVENSHLADVEKKVRQSRSATPISVSRTDLLTVLRTERDFRKLPLFCVVFAVFFETTPIVLWMFPRLAPSTCYSEKFVNKLGETFSQRRADLREAAAAISSGSAPMAGSAASTHADNRSGRASEARIARIDGSESVFRLPSSLLRKLAVTLDLGRPYKVLPLALVRRAVLRHITLVRADDATLRQNERHLDDLDPTELSRALAARCLPPDGGVPALRKWLAEFHEPMDAGYFIISSGVRNTLPKN